MIRKEVTPLKLKDLLKDIEISDITADPEAEIGGVAYDSRRVKPGDLFVAVEGFRSDGHEFIPMALEKGAAAVLCRVPPEGDVPYVRAEDTRRALAIASRNFFGDPAGEMKLVGVTGTNGKTTTTLLIKRILEAALGAKVGLIGTNGNMIGGETLPTERTTPESYELQKLLREMADAGCAFAVMEVSSHALALERTAGLSFDVAAFTNLTQDHLDFHGTMEAYGAEKLKLMDQSAAAAVNLDDPWAGRFIARAAGKALTYACDDNAADMVAKDLRLKPGKVCFRALYAGELYRVDLGIPGRFSVYNALCALSCCALLGVAPEAAVAALGTAEGVKGRMETVPTDGDYTVLIDYAHTPDALEKLLKTVRESAPGRLIAVFGCGGDRDRAKRPLMGKIGTSGADFAVITSDNPRGEDPEKIIADILAGVTAPKNKYAVIPDRAAAIAYAIGRARDGDVIVLAGKGHETYQEINGVKHPMDEREIVKDLLERRKTV